MVKKIVFLFLLIIASILLFTKSSFAATLYSNSFFSTSLSDFTGFSSGSCSTGILGLTCSSGQNVYTLTDFSTMKCVQADINPGSGSFTQLFIYDNIPNTRRVIVNLASGQNIFFEATNTGVWSTDYEPGSIGIQPPTGTHTYTFCNGSGVLSLYIDNILVGSASGDSNHNLSAISNHFPGMTIYPTEFFSNFNIIDSLPSSITTTPTPSISPTPIPTPVGPFAPSNGSWNRVGSMATSRITFSATTLQNGEILAAGGNPSGGMPLINSTELYNPTTQSWSITGSLNTPRRTYFNSLVTLQNGKALIAGGGLVNNTPLGSSELYDPTNGTWSYTGSLNTPRRDAVMTLLDDGRVLVAGGTDSQSGGSLSSSELYDPISGAWSYTSNNLTHSREGSSMLKMPGGKVLIVGGNEGAGCTNQAEIFNPATNTWTSAGTMPWEPNQPMMTSLLDGRIFVVGGTCPNNFANSAIYNPATNVWTSTAPMNLPRSASIAFLLANGDVMITSGAASPTSEVYDPITNSWSSGPSLADDRDGSVWSNLANGDVLAIGGWKCDPNNASCTLASADLFTTINHSPVVSFITAPTSPAQVNTSITASASFTDANVSDTHTASWNWGDGTITTGTVNESNGSGSISNNHTYTSAGVYTVMLTVTDNHGASGTNQYQYIVVYDPSAGFLTAAGKYNSTAGWDLQNMSAAGEVKLGINAKYTGSNNVPTGNAKISFKTGNIDFSSTAYSWLVVNGTKAYLMGTGTINGNGSYSFFISAIDGNQTRGENLIRLQIRDNSNQNIFYDTQPGVATTADPTTPLTSGNIQIH